MPPRLLPESPLSQVVFVHDYIQLVFQNEGFSLYNRTVVKFADREFAQGEIGFADALISLIGQAVTEVGPSTGWVLSLGFEGGARVNLLKADGAANPEAFQFSGLRGLIVAEQNE